MHLRGDHVGRLLHDIGPAPPPALAANVLGELVEGDVDAAVAEGVLLAAGAEGAAEPFEAVVDGRVGDAAADVGLRDALLADAAAARQRDGLPEERVAQVAVEEVDDVLEEEPSGARRRG